MKIMEKKGKNQNKTTLAYTYFVKLIRDEHRKKHPEEKFDFSEFATKCSEKWKSMKPEERKRFEELAVEENDKKPQGRKKRARKRQKKDPGQPKRAWSAFFYFCDERRPSIRKEHLDWRVSDVARELGRLWESCVDRDRYDKLASLDKERYEKEMELFRAGNYIAGETKRPKFDDNHEEDICDEEDQEEDNEDDDIIEGDNHEEPSAAGDSCRTESSKVDASEGNSCEMKHQEEKRNIKEPEEEIESTKEHKEQNRSEVGIEEEEDDSKVEDGTKAVDSEDDKMKLENPVSGEVEKPKETEDTTDRMPIGDMETCKNGEGGEVTEREEQCPKEDTGGTAEDQSTVS